MAVKELGKVLPPWLLDFMANVPAKEHAHFSRMDFANSYMVVKPEAHWNCVYIMPSIPGEPLEVVVPSALQMGWNESAAYFCTTTETV